MPRISKPSHSSDTSDAATLSSIDADLGSCRRAGRQDEAAPVPVPRNDGPTDIFGRPLDRRQQALELAQTGRRTGWVTWPIIGKGTMQPDGATFQWADHSADFKRGTTVTVYVAVSDGLCTLGKNARLSLGKIGLSTRPDLTQRIAEANADRYGSLHESDGKIVDADGFDTWEPIRLPPTAAPSYPSPVELMPRALNVSLPGSLRTDDFDAALTALLDACRVDRWIDSADGKLHCARHDVDPCTLRRLTSHVNADGNARLKRSREIYVYRRREDTGRLIAAIEGLVAKHLAT